MKIATWNLDRPQQLKPRTRRNLLLEKLRNQCADIFVLTETNTSIDLSPEYAGFCSKEARSAGRMSYAEGERRVIVWARREYRMTRLVETRDSESSVCVALRTDAGELFIYGTVLGALGRPTSGDLTRQIADWKTIGLSNSICIAGDFNTSFKDDYHFTHEARNRISNCFAELKISNATASRDECIDHIAISKSFIKSAALRIDEWNPERKKAIPRLSDHKGISVNLTFSNT